MLTRCSLPLNTAFHQNKRMIYLCRYRRSLFPNQIFRCLILINGAFNVIFPLNIHRNVAVPPPLNHQSVRHLFSPFLSFQAPMFPLHTAPFLFSLPVLCFLALTNTSVNEQTTLKEKGNLFLPTEGWRDFTLCLLSDTTFNLGEERRWFKTSETTPECLCRLWNTETEWRPFKGFNPGDSSLGTGHVYFVPR